MFHSLSWMFVNILAFLGRPRGETTQPRSGTIRFIKAYKATLQPTHYTETNSQWDLKLYGSHYFEPSPVKKWAQANFLRFGKMQEAHGGPYRGFQVSKNLWYFVWEQNRESISLRVDDKWWKCHLSEC